MREMYVWLVRSDLLISLGMLSMFLPVCLTASLCASVRLSVCLSLRLNVCRSVCLCIYLFIYLCVWVSTLFTCLSLLVWPLLASLMDNLNHSINIIISSHYFISLCIEHDLNFFILHFFSKIQNLKIIEEQKKNSYTEGYKIDFLHFL